jgi:hypothetical protein
MGKKYFFISAVFSLLFVSGVHAQEDTRDALKSYSFLELQGGVQLTTNDVKMSKLITPTAALSFGHFFSPVVGARIHVNGWQAKGGFDDLDQYYKWKYMVADVDMLVNLTNMISKNPYGKHPLNVMLLAGLGVNHAWKNDLDMTAYNIPMTWNKNRLSHNLRVGVRLETDVTKPVGVSLEVNANSLSDRFNSKINSRDDWQFTAMLGISFRFGKRYSKPLPVALPVVQDALDAQAAATAAALLAVSEKKKVKKDVTREENVQLHKEGFYQIRVTELSDENIYISVAQFLKNNKNAQITVVGYADKGTGTAIENQRYAKERAENFKNKLVKDYGVNASSVLVDSKGDTVQPFSENDKNRCVLIDGKGIRVYTETIEVEE